MDGQPRRRWLSSSSKHRRRSATRGRSASLLSRRLRPMSTSCPIEEERVMSDHLGFHAARMFVAILVLTSASSRLKAADRYWLGPSGGSFFDNANWSATDGGPG